MAKHTHEQHRRDLMREELAHRAAKLMAEDGITDHAFAKRKAAKQLGASDTKHLPSNQEVDEALASYRLLYQSDSHPNILRALRQEALQVMQLFAEFQPYLTGSVLSGTAGEHSDINLVLFSDDAKAVLLFLHRHKIEFTESELRERIGGREVTVPSYIFDSASGAVVHLLVLPERERHSGRRQQDTHADLQAVESLLVA